jgi:PAS domain S-box-containing protein
MDDQLNHAPCGFLAFTDEGQITQVNATVVELLGYQKEEVVGSTLNSILTIGSQVFCQTHLLPMLRIQGRLEEIFLIVREKSGAELGVMVNVVRREREGAYVNEAIMFRMRERQQFESELLRARRVAEEAQEALEAQRDSLRLMNEALVQRTEELNRQRLVAEDASQAKGTFLSFMSHELRTPLNAILGFAQLLEMSDLAPEDVESVEYIRTAGNHLLHLINEVLDLTSIEAGRLHLSVEPLSVTSVVEFAMGLVRMTAAERRIEITQEPPPDGEWLVRADRRRFHQVLLNLLSNAVKYNRVEGTVVIRYEEAPDAMCRVLVEDSGYGIPPEQLGHLFTPFERLGAEQTTIQGTGLGLALSRKLIEAMGGRIGADSVVGEGSTFWVELPRAEARE